MRSASGVGLDDDEVPRLDRPGGALGGGEEPDDEGEAEAMFDEVFVQGLQDPGSIDKACDAVKAKGGKVTREPGPMKFGGSVIAFVEDPDGYKIEFIQKTT